MTRFIISATYDVLCPFSYMGHVKLHRAIAEWHEAHPASDDTFLISYIPYQLAPDMPRGPASSTPKAEYFFARFGPDRTADMQARLEEAGQPLGIAFKFGGATGNSRDAHRLVQLAKRRQTQAAQAARNMDGLTEAKLETVILDALFAAYFEQERDITDFAVLRDIAVQAGIPVEEFEKTIVRSDEGGKAVDDATKLASLRGVKGVPFIVVQHRWRFNGATEPAEYLEAFEKLASKK